MNSILHRAAVLGRFDPMVLIKDAADQGRVLSALAPLCDEVKHDGAMAWIMRADERRNLLGGLSTRALKSALVAAAELKTDRFGGYLHMALSGRRVSDKGLSIEALKDLQAALEFVGQKDGEDLDLPARAALRAREIRRKISRKSADASLRLVSPEKLYGRTGEYQALVDFSQSGEVAEKYATAEHSEERWIFLVTGVGGVGKSALTFDRPGLSSGDTLQLMFEVTRQLGLQRPDIDDLLSRYRYELREMFSDATLQSFDLTQSLFVRGLGLLALHLEENWKDFGKPIVIVLDTFEEILDRGPKATNFILDWLSMLREHVGFTNLRVIIGSRVSPGPEFEMLHGALSGHIPLVDLKPRAAQSMLVGFGMDKARATRAVDAFGGNPLTLIILMRYARDMGAKETDALIDEGAKHDVLSGLLAQQFLYSRILLRLRDDELEKLASPGLALRRVTPQIIQDVLAVPCGIALRDEAHLADIWQRLRAKVWLVESEDETTVRHVRSLRNVMLDQLGAKDPAGVEAIHKAAVAYYEAGLDRAMPISAQNLEALYHRLLLGEEDALTEENAPALMTHLGGDSANLTPSLQARLTLWGDEQAVLNEGQVSLLKPFKGAVKKAQRRSVKAQLNVGQSDVSEFEDLLNQKFKPVSPPLVETPAPAQSSQKMVRQKRKPRVHIDYAVEIDDDIVEALFTEGRFDKLRDVSDAVLGNYIDGYDQSTSLRDFIFSSPWRVALAFRAEGEHSQWWRDNAILTYEARKERQSLEVPLPENFARLARLWSLSILLDDPDCAAFFANEARPMQKISRSFNNLGLSALRFTKLNVWSGLDVPFPFFERGDFPMGNYRTYTKDFFEQLKPDFGAGRHGDLRHVMAQIGLMANPHVRISDSIELSKLDKAMRNLVFIDGPGASNLVPGFVPELHGVLRRAIEARSYWHQEIPRCVSRLLEENSEKISIWPATYSPENLAKSTINSSMLAGIIEAADRADCLVHLLENCMAEHSDYGGYEVATALQLFQNYDALLRP